MIGVDLEEDAAAAEAFGKQHGISFPLAVEDEERAKKAFGVLGCPNTVVIDRNGRMVGRGAGEGDWSSESARALVRSLLRIGPAASAPAAAGGKPARKAVHLVSAVRTNDSKLNEVLDEAAASLKAGDEVSILFDGQSVGALRTAAQRTPLEGAKLTSKERISVAKRLGVSPSTAPRNQFEYIQQLAKAGAKVLVNANAIRALGLSDGEIHPLAKRVSVGEMEKIVDESDACYTYQHE